MVLLGAGTATTARTLGFISYYILAYPHIKERLQKELESVTAGFPEKPPKWVDLEKVVYLQAVIKEGLRLVLPSYPSIRIPGASSQLNRLLARERLSFGVMRRLPRCSPDVALQYKQWTIPKNVRLQHPNKFAEILTQKSLDTCWNGCIHDAY